jgi:uncharacterized protein YjbI with pentapeptide repeats
MEAGKSDSVPILKPNMIALNADATSSTFATMKAPHSLVTGSNWFNSVIHNSNLESCSFQNSELDGSLFDSCSLRGVELRNCDIEGLIVNGVRVGSLLKLLLVSDGGKHGTR